MRFAIVVAPSKKQTRRSSAVSAELLAERLAEADAHFQVEWVEPGAGALARFTDALAARADKSGQLLVLYSGRARVDDEGRVLLAPGRTKGGINLAALRKRVAADGAVAEGGYPWAPSLDGGFTVLELPTREEAIVWAARLARACRCEQELRVFGLDPES